MEETRQVTLKDALVMTRSILYGVQVPLSMKELVIDPIWAAIGNLDLCINTIQNAENAEKQNKQQDEILSVEVVEINGVKE